MIYNNVKTEHKFQGIGFFSHLSPRFGT